MPQGASGFLFWREYPTDWTWKEVSLIQENGFGTATIPVQPTAGKVEFYFKIDAVRIPAGESTVVARYKNPVPAWALVPHILLMFAGMLLSNRLGLGMLFKEPIRPELVYITFGTLTVGGLIFGPIVQQYAFNAAWTGWPVGTDLTDNKMLISWISWLIPAVLIMKNKLKSNLWILLAAVITLGVYMIPHSVLGSEHNYSQKIVEP